MDLLRNIESTAYTIRDRRADDFEHAIDSPTPNVHLPLERPLYRPATAVEVTSDGIEEGHAEGESTALFDQVHIDPEPLIARVRTLLRRTDQVTLADVIADAPIEQGLAELITYLSLTDEGFTKTFDESATETVSWTDDTGRGRTATVPRVIYVRPAPTRDHPARNDLDRNHLRAHESPCAPRRAEPRARGHLADEGRRLPRHRRDRVAPRPRAGGTDQRLRRDARPGRGDRRSRGLCLPAVKGDDELADLGIPRLVARHQLPLHASLLLALLRKKLAEHDTTDAGNRLVLTADQLRELIGPFFPASTNEARTVDQADTAIRRVTDLGFLRRMPGQDGEYEVRRVIKAYVDAQWLADFDTHLAEYAEAMMQEQR